MRAVNFPATLGRLGLVKQFPAQLIGEIFRSDLAAGGLELSFNTRTRENIGIKGIVGVSTDNYRLTKPDLTFYSSST